MKRDTATIAHSVAWAAAIIASAALGAPTVLTLVLLPALATVAWAPGLSRCRS
jgi:hypothetical protein